MRRIELVPINLISMDRWPFGRVLGLVAHLEAGGTVPPVHVARVYPEGGFRILDGRHRMHAFKLLGRTHILARWGEKQARYCCTRCCLNEHEARAVRCARSPCPMELATRD